MKNQTYEGSTGGIVLNQEALYSGFKCSHFNSASGSGFASALSE